MSGVQTSDDYLSDMYKAAWAVELDTRTIQDADLRELMQALAESLRDQASAVAQLRGAVMSSNPREERTALRHLARASAERARLAQELLNITQG